MGAAEGRREGGGKATCSKELVLSFSKPKMSRMPMTCAHCGPRLTSLIFLTIRSKRRELIALASASRACRNSIGGKGQVERANGVRMER